MAQTVIGKANELIKNIGHDKAIEFFEEKIELYKTNDNGSFKSMCNISGLEVAVKYIKRDKQS